MIKIDTKNTWIFILSRPSFIKCFNINPFNIFYMSNMLGDFIIYIRSSLYGVPSHRYQAKVAPGKPQKKSSLLI